jgi:uncharacterized protein (DUF2147 family)
MKQIALLILLTALSLSGFSQAKDVIIGKYVNASGEAHVDIYKKNEKYYGKIVWLKNPKNEQGAIKTDVRNPEDKLKLKPLLGLEILKDFIYDGDKWTDGKIYDPKSGKTYSCNLNIRGYIGISIIGRSEVWKKVN